MTEIVTQPIDTINVHLTLHPVTTMTIVAVTILEMDMKVMEHEVEVDIIRKEVVMTLKEMVMNLKEVVMILKEADMTLREVVMNLKEADMTLKEEDMTLKEADMTHTVGAMEVEVEEVMMIVMAVETPSTIETDNPIPATIVMDRTRIDTGTTTILMMTLIGE